MISLLLISLYYMDRQLSRQSRGLKILVSMVQFHLCPPICLLKSACISYYKIWCSINKQNPRTMTGLEVCETLFGVEIRVDVGHESLTKIYELNLSNNSRRKIIKRIAHQYPNVGEEGPHLFWEQDISVASSATIRTTCRKKV